MDVKGNVSRCTSSVSKSRQGRSSFARPVFPVPRPRACTLQGAPHVPTSPRKRLSAVPGSMPLAATRLQLRVPATPGAGDKGGGPRGQLGGLMRAGAACPAEVAASAGSCSSPALQARSPGLAASATSR